MDFKTGRGKTPIPPSYRKNWQRQDSDECPDCPPVGGSAGTVILTVSDSTPNFGDTVTLTITPTEITPQRGS